MSDLEKEVTFLKVCLLLKKQAEDLRNAIDSTYEKIKSQHRHVIKEFKSETDMIESFILSLSDDESPNFESESGQEINAAAHAYRERLKGFKMVSAKIIDDVHKCREVECDLYEALRETRAVANYFLQKLLGDTPEDA